MYYKFALTLQGDLDNPDDITKGDIAKKAYDNRSLLGEPKVTIDVAMK